METTINKTKFTPGPWKLETVKTSIGSCHKIGEFPKNFQGDKTYACVYADNINIGDEKYNKIGAELLANARLIAAAPEMYKVIEELLRIYDKYANDNPAEDHTADYARDILNKIQ